MSENVLAGNGGCFPSPPNTPAFPQDPATAAAGVIIDGIRTILGGSRTDPEMIRIIEQQQKLSDENYKKEVERREAVRKEHNDRMERAQNAADEVLKQMRLDNKECIRQMQEKLDSDQAKFEEEMEKKSKDHYEEMKELKNKSIEDWKAADKNHQEETKELHAAHEKEKKEANKKIEEARKLGLKKIEDAEKALQNIEQDRFQQNEKFFEVMKEMEEKHQEEKRKLREAEFELRRKCIDQKREQASIENKRKMDELDQHFNNLTTRLETNSTRSLLEEFKRVVQTTETTSSSLKLLSICCIDDSPVAFKATITLDLDSVATGMEFFKARIRCFEKFKLTELNVHPEALQLCNNYIATLKKSMGSKEILRIHNLLGPAIKNGDFVKVKTLGMEAEKLSEQFEIVTDELDFSLNELNAKLVTAAPAQTALNNEDPRSAD